VCCSVLQCGAYSDKADTLISPLVAVCCSVLQCGAYSDKADTLISHLATQFHIPNDFVLQCVAVCCRVLHVLQCVLRHNIFLLRR